MYLRDKIRRAAGLVRLYSSPRGKRNVVPPATESVIVMPIFGEVAYEVLYWLPFVNQSLRNFRGRIVYWGRDGSETWFQKADSHQLLNRNMFDVIERERFLEWQSSEVLLNGNLKQRNFSRNSWIYNRLFAESLNDGHLDSTYILTPETMFSLVAPAIVDPLGIRWRQIKSSFAHRKINLERSDFFDRLPPRYNACRLYSKGGELDFSNAVTQDRALESIVDLYDASLPLVDLSPPEDFQDHKSWSPPSDLATSIWSYLPYETTSNLFLQSLVISRSESLLTSHGGLAYLSIALGTPTVAVEGSETIIFQLHRKALDRMVRYHGTSYRTLII